MTTTATRYLEGHIASEAQIAEWVEQFHRDGYLFLPKFLTRDFCRELREDLDKDFARDESDMDAGRAVGAVLVRVGEPSSAVDFACGSLPEAVDWLLAR